MAIQINRQGLNYAPNVANYAMSFNDGTWNIRTGTGNVNLDNTTAFEGSKCLKIENTDTKNDIVVSNNNQDTIIKQNGDYQISFYAKKTKALEVREVDVLIYKNGVLLDTQTATLGSTNADEDINNIWQRFQCNRAYSFLKDDIITFQFSLKSAITGDLTTLVYIDALMICQDDRLNGIAPIYEKTNNNYNDFTGWSEYRDSTYTTGSPLTLVDGVKIDLPNNKGITDESQKPIDIPTFYNGTVITGRNGDDISITIEFKCRPTTAAADVRVFTAIDIGGSIGEIYPLEIGLSKGSGVEHYFNKVIEGFTKGTWEANGGTVKIEAINSGVEVYDIRYVIKRTHKAR